MAGSLRALAAIALCVALAPVAALAQGSVLQGGKPASGRAPMYSFGGGSGQTVIQDSGPASGGLAGLGLSEILQVNRSPTSSSGTGPNGTHDCHYSAPIVSGAYYYLCLDAYANGGGLISYGKGGSASALPFQLVINGQTANLTGLTFPPAGIPNSTGAAWSTSYTTSGSGSVVALATGPTISGATLSGATAITGAATLSGAGTALNVTNNGTFGSVTTASVQSGGTLALNPSGGPISLDGVAAAWGVSATSSQTPAAGGSGYGVGQTMTLNDGCGTHGVLYVAQISGGGSTGPVTGYTIANPGSCAAPVANPIGVLSTSGSGTGATFTLTFAPLSSASASSLSGVISPNVANPSSGNLVGPGCAVAHQVMYADQNVCSIADSWQVVSMDPSAVTVLTVGGTCTAGDVITLQFFYGALSPTVSYTVLATGSGTACTSAIVNGLVAAIQANSTLFNNTSVTTAFGAAPQGGYGGGGVQYQIGYVTPNGNTQLAFDWNTTYPQGAGSQPMLMKYTVTGSATETITFPVGWFAGKIFAGGTSGGSANAQTVTASGFTGTAGQGIVFTAGFTNAGAMTLNVNGLGAATVSQYVNGVITPVGAGVVVSGTAYSAVFDFSGNWILGSIAAWATGGSTPGTTYQLPNSLDNNPAIVTGRQLPQAVAANAPGSVIAAFYATGSNSSLPNARTINYGNLSFWTNNAQGGGAQSGAWILQTSQGPGWWFGSGIYNNQGCSFPFDPTTAGCMIDKGNGTINAGVGYWLSGTQNGQGASLLLNGGVVTLSGGTGNLPVTVSTGGNINLNGSSALSNSATTGFVNLPFTTGTPTGAPAGNDNCAINTSTKVLNCYIGGSWWKLSMTAGAG